MDLNVVLKMNPLSHALFCLVFITISVANALPWRMEEEIDLKGEVESVVWITSSFSYDGDEFTTYNSAPATRCFMIINAPGLTEKQLNELSRHARIFVYSGVSHMMMRQDLKQNQALFFLPIGKGIKVNQGSKIEVEGYTAWGDERMVVPTIKSLKIDGQAIKVPETLSPKVKTEAK